MDFFNTGKDFAKFSQMIFFFILTSENFRFAIANYRKLQFLF